MAKERIYRHTDKYFTTSNLPFTVPRKYDDKDNVDRLSYCDNTTMILRSMQAGKQLMYNNAQALYQDMESVENDKSPIATPVYADDMVIAQQKADALNGAIADYTAGLSAGSNESKAEVVPADKPVEAGAEGPKAE